MAETEKPMPCTCLLSCHLHGPTTGLIAENEILLCIGHEIGEENVEIYRESVEQPVSYISKHTKSEDPGSLHGMNLHWTANQLAGTRH